MTADELKIVFPTCVGMNRPFIFTRYVLSGVPHVCGDEPKCEIRGSFQTRCSPRVWG